MDFEFINVDMDEDAMHLVEEINDGKRIIQTLDLNGKPLINPDNTTLAEVFGIKNVSVIQFFGADLCPDCRRA